jgi:DNA invertase Pin-like site-specific DNA recombinase
MTTTTASTAPATRPATVRAVLYQRISDDRLGDEHGVTNQRADAERLAEARGWTVAGIYTDNDISAYSGARRPGYEAMMAAAARRELDAIVVFQTSRLWRNRVERAAGIKVLQEARVSVVATKGPSLDMTTAYGRAMAGLLGEFDTMESEVKSERQQLAYQAQRDQGIRHGGPARLAGTREGREAIAWAADALLGGSTVAAVAREWDRRGLRPPQAPFGPLPEHPWKRNSVTTILRNPATAGLRAYSRREKGDDGKARLVRTIVTDEDGQPVRIAGEDPVLDEETWRAVAALLEAPGRKPAQGVRTLLGGLMRCACGNPVTGTIQATGRHAYRCNPQTRGTRPGPHAQQVAAPVDRWVSVTVVERLSQPDAAGLTAPKRPNLTPLHREAAAIRANLDEMAADRALGLVTREQMIAATNRERVRLAELEEQLAASVSTSALAPFAAAESASKVWDGLDRERRRAVIGALCEVTLRPAGRGARTFNPETVVIAWHEQA